MLFLARRLKSYIQEWVKKPPVRYFENNLKAQRRGKITINPTSPIY